MNSNLHSYMYVVRVVGFTDIYVCASYPDVSVLPARPEGSVFTARQQSVRVYKHVFIALTTNIVITRQHTSNFMSDSSSHATDTILILVLDIRLKLFYKTKQRNGMA